MAENLRHLQEKKEIDPICVAAEVTELTAVTARNFLRKICNSSEVLTLATYFTWRWKPGIMLFWLCACAKYQLNTYQSVRQISCQNQRCDEFRIRVQWSPTHFPKSILHRRLKIWWCRIWIFRFSLTLQLFLVIHWLVGRSVVGLFLLLRK